MANRQGRRALGTALAQRALFDLSPEVREAALQALQTRNADDVRPVLLAGLRYPWAPVADHAAEALVTLGDQAAIPLLEELAKEPDPRAVIGGADKPTLQSVRELVRVNHLTNCFLCHAPATVKTNLVLGRIPVVGKPLPQTPYYGSESPPVLIVGNFVRADVTYLKQDFSVPQPVVKAGAWPVEQRHDYVVRTRKPTRAEQAAFEANPYEYPQKGAVRFALRELKGETDAAAEEVSPAGAEQPTKAAEKVFSVGDRVEARSRKLDWLPAVVVSVRSSQYQVQYDGRGSAWVGADRLRSKVWE
jgi:hypothetical protein